METGLPVEVVSCPLCHEPRSTPLFAQRDMALGVPGQYTIVRCDGCGLLYQNPRVSGAPSHEPRYISRSLKAWLGDEDHLASRLGRAVVSSRLGGGALKLLLEIGMPLARPLGLGEAVRYAIVPAVNRPA